MNETKTRTFIKASGWRIIAIINSFTVLSCNLSNDHLYNAIIMNFTGFIVYVIYERVCNKIRMGINEKN